MLAFIQTPYTASFICLAIHSYGTRHGTLTYWAVALPVLRNNITPETYVSNLIMDLGVSKVSEVSWQKGKPRAAKMLGLPPRLVEKKI